MEPNKIPTRAGRSGHKVPISAKELVTTVGCWGRENQVFLNVWPQDIKDHLECGHTSKSVWATQIGLDG